MNWIMKEERNINWQREARLKSVKKGVCEDTVLEMTVSESGVVVHKHTGLVETKHPWLSIICGEFYY